MTDTSNYWRRQVSRRTALRSAAAVGGGLGALSLIGCGGDDNGSGGGGSGESAAALDSTKGIPGGTYKTMLPGPVVRLTVIDQVTGSAIRNGGLVHSSLLGYKWGQDGIKPNDTTLEPDLAQAMPEQPDELTYVYKLRPGVKFHNGRALVSDDIRYTAVRYGTADISAYKQTFTTWLDRVETPDASTAVIKTKFPFADTLNSFAGVPDGFVLCKEHEEGPDLQTKMVGTGPYMFAGQEPPVSWTYKRNPDYYNKPYPYFDEIITYAAADPVRRIANFTTREVQGAWVVYSDDRDTIKQLRPDAKVQQNGWVATAAYYRTDKPPFNDKRVRQAVSMSIDRKKVKDAVMQGEGDPDQFFPLIYAPIYGTHAKVSELGAAARSWDFNPTMAKQLLSAAGVAPGFEFTFNCYDPATAGQWHTDQCVLAQATWRELGIFNAKVVTGIGAVSQQWATGNFEGIATYQSPTVPSVQIGNAVRDNLYMGPNGDRSPKNASWVNNPQLNPLLDKQIRQLKAEDRKQTFREIEAIVSEEQYRLYFSNTVQNWFWDPSAKNTAMPQEITMGTRFMMKWWYQK